MYVDLEEMIVEPGRSRKNYGRVGKRLSDESRRSHRDWDGPRGTKVGSDDD